MKHRSALRLGVTILLAVGLAVGWQWWRNRRSDLPDGIATGNGRIEAVQVDIATKYPGRVHEILVEEGDMVERGQVLATMDTSELDAAHSGARAQLARAEEAVSEASAVIVQRESALRFAEQELARALPLAERGSISKRLAQQRQSTRDSAKAALDVARAHHRTAEETVEAARAAVKQVEVQLSECVLKAATGGRVLYRLAEPGEVLPGGGRVLRLIDLNDIYMEVFLAAREASRLAIGAEARIIVDALPQYVIPGDVSFVSPEAQFTPKQVETQDERDKLMFRVKVRVPHDVVAPHVAVVKTGVRGVAYVRVDSAVAWPPNLRVLLPDDERQWNRTR